VTGSEVIQGIAKVLFAGLDVWRQHEAELAARAEVHDSALEDLVAVTGQAPVPKDP